MNILTKIVLAEISAYISDLQVVLCICMHMCMCIFVRLCMCVSERCHSVPAYKPLCQKGTKNKGGGPKKGAQVEKRECI